MGKTKFNPKNARPSAINAVLASREGMRNSTFVKHGETYNVDVQLKEQRVSAKAYCSRIEAGIATLILGLGEEICRIRAPMEDITLSSNGINLGDRVEIGGPYERGSIEHYALRKFVPK